MAIHSEKKQLQEDSLRYRASLTLQAQWELLTNGSTSIRCPKCGKAPVTKTTEGGERTTTKCPCGYLRSGEINL